MKKALLFLALLVFCITVVIAIQRGQSVSGAQTHRVEKQLQIGSQKLNIEVADTIPKITLGLGERDTLGSDGMLFVMPTRTVPMFWMKGMRFPLDFVWIDGGKVIDLTENVPAEPGVSDANLKIYSPKVPATHVLEINAGEIKRRGIAIGDAISY